MADESYIRKLRETLDAKVQANHERTRKENCEDDLIKAAAPRDWTELKQWLRDTTEEVNKGRSEGMPIYEDGDDQNHFKIHCFIGENRKNADIKFFNLAGTLITVRGSATIEFDCYAQGREIQWTTDSRLKVWTIEQIGKRILDSVIP
jgi:hypothetical protein